MLNVRKRHYLLFGLLFRKHLVRKGTKQFLFKNPNLISFLIFALHFRKTVVIFSVRHIKYVILANGTVLQSGSANATDARVLAEVLCTYPLLGVTNNTIDQKFRPVAVDAGLIEHFNKSELLPDQIIVVFPDTTSVTTTRLDFATQ